jgi:mRNA interferase MazF
MLFGIMLKQRDIVLIPIPFTDLTSQKRRPDVGISSDNYNETHEDIVVVNF